MENETLVLDLLEWLAEQPQPYEIVMDAWRTSCPRLTVWEDTVDAGFVEIRIGGDMRKTVALSDPGKEFLRLNQREHA